MRKLVALGVICVPAIAAAHVRILSPTPRSSTQLKERHCGQTGSARANVSTLPPGSPLHLVWDEYINHPGWFRVSFQQNGDTFEIPPASDGPTGSGAPSNYPTEDLTGMTDPGTGSLVIADRIADGTLSLDFNLPDVECDNCTLQLIQLMTDKPPYTTDTASNDIYFACVDLVLSATAPDAAPAPPDAAPGTPDGGVGQDAGNPAMGNGGGCCSVTGGPSGILTALAMVGLLRRRRPRR